MKNYLKWALFLAVSASLLLPVALGTGRWKHSTECSCMVQDADSLFSLHAGGG